MFGITTWIFPLIFWLEPVSFLVCVYVSVRICNGHEWLAYFMHLSHTHTHAQKKTRFVCLQLCETHSKFIIDRSHSFDCFFSSLFYMCYFFFHLANKIAIYFYLSTYMGYSFSNIHSLWPVASRLMHS